MMFKKKKKTQVEIYKACEQIHVKSESCEHKLILKKHPNKHPKTKSYENELTVKN